MSKPNNHDDLKSEWVEEERKTFSGWDFSHLRGRMLSESLPWDYRETVIKYLESKHDLLDMGTGGGEFLLSLKHPYCKTSITEGYLPNVELCHKKLAPLGITVKEIADDDIIPYESSKFDIVLNRHESFNAQEVYRVLKPGGIFITQQVGEENNRDLARVLCGKYQRRFGHHYLDENQKQLKESGFTLLQSGEHFPTVKFFDVGAIVYFAKIISWEFPDFSVEKCFSELLTLHNIIEEKGYIDSYEHRFYIVCSKPIN